jgi:hypothetical protein
MTDLRRASRGEMLFAPAQCGFICAEVIVRLMLQRAAVESASLE